MDSKQEEAVEQRPSTFDDSFTLGNTTQFLALASAISFGFGMCAILGAYMAIGSNLKEFVVFEDVVTSTLTVSPFVFLGVGWRFFSDMLGKPIQKPISERYYTLSICMLMILTLSASAIYWLFPMRFSLLYFFVFAAMLFFAQKVTSYRVDKNLMNPVSAIIIDIFFFAIILISLAYNDRYIAFERKEPSHFVCTNAECRSGVLLDRIAAGLILRWVDDETATFIPNSRVSSVTGLASANSRPILDLFGFGNDSGTSTTETDGSEVRQPMHEERTTAPNDRVGVQ